MTWLVLPLAFLASVIGAAILMLHVFAWVTLDLVPGIKERHYGLVALSALMSMIALAAGAFCLFVAGAVIVDWIQRVL